MLDKLREIRLWVEVVLAIAVLVFGAMWWQKFTEPAPVGLPIEAEAADVIDKVPTEKIECAPIVVYKEPAKKKLNLPPSVQQDKAKVVVDATDVKPDIRSHTITTVLDTDTGKTITYDTRNKLPWLAIDTRGEAGIIYAHRGGEQIIRFEARQALFDIKAVKIGGVANYDMPLGGGSGAFLLGAGAWYRW